MLIGQDFDKIKLDIFGLHLLEPNAFIGDVIILLIALILAYKTKKLDNTAVFFKYWKWFFIVIGVGFFLGGLGHLFYNYSGIPGKTPSWYCGIIACFLVEFALLSIFPNQKLKTILIKISFVKMITVLIIETIIFFTVDLSIDQSKGLIVPTINSIIGLGLTMGFLGYYYQKKINYSFKYLWLSTLVLIPSAVFQGMKINIHPWLDRNDVSHILLIFGLLLYYKSISGYSKNKKLKS